MVPVVLYAIWYVGFGSRPRPKRAVRSQPRDKSGVRPRRLREQHRLPAWAWERRAFRDSGGARLGAPPAVALVVASIWVLRRRPTRRWILVLSLAVGITFWFITAAQLRPRPAAHRLAVPVRRSRLRAADRRRDRRWLAAGAGARSWRPLRWRAAAALSNLRDPARRLSELDGRLDDRPRRARGTRDGRRPCEPQPRPHPANSDFDYFDQVTAGPYLSASEKFGSPAYSQSELASAPESAREAADKVLAAALPVSLRPGGAQPPSGGAPPRVVGPPNARSSMQGSCVTVTGLAPDASYPRAAAWRRHPEDARRRSARAAAPSLRLRPSRCPPGRCAGRRAWSFRPTARAVRGSCRSGATDRSPPAPL